MRGSRPLSTALVLLLAHATQFSLSPLLGGGPDAVDIPLLVLIWFALIDRFPRVVAIATALVSLRWFLGASSPIVIVIPIAAAILWVRIARAWIDPRNHARRLAIAFGAVAIVAFLHRVLWSVPWSGSVDAYATGLLLATGVTALLYPILDLTPPLLRSADYPL